LHSAVAQPRAEVLFRHTTHLNLPPNLATRQCNCHKAPYVNIAEMTKLLKLN